MGLPRQVIEKARRQGGYMTRTQLLDVGLSVGAIDRRVGAGDLNVVSKGTYQVFVSTDHIDLMLGAMLALPDAVASHQSAAHLLDFPVLPELVPTVTVPSHTTHEFRGLIVRRCDDVDKSHLTTINGVRVTTVARTAFDLGRVLEYHEFDEVVEALILDGRLKPHHFERITSELARRGKPGSRAAKDFIAIRLGGDRLATALERKGRRILASAGLPEPIPQHPIPWNPGRRFDDAYPEARLAVEWDSRAWHLQKKAMAADRRRDREAALHGWYVIRFTWEDVTKEPGKVADTITTLVKQRRVS